MNTAAKARAYRAGAAAAVVVVLLSACGGHRHTSAEVRQDTAQPSSVLTSPVGSITAASPRPVPASTSPIATPAPIDEPAAVAVARAMTGVLCAYDWRSPVPYGTSVNAALHRYASAPFAAARAWSPAHITAATSDLVAHQASQACTAITGGLMAEQPNTATTVYVRMSATVTASAADATPSTAQQVFLFTLRYSAGRWLITDGRW